MVEDCPPLLPPAISITTSYTALVSAGLTFSMVMGTALLTLCAEHSTLFDSSIPILISPEPEQFLGLSSD